MNSAASALRDQLNRNNSTKTERGYVAAIILAVLILTSLPYLFAYSVSSTFVGQVYNIVDYSVYLSWTRQAADGHFGTVNLFTTVKQHGYLFNLLFLLLGNIVRATSLPIPIVFQVFRLIGGGLLLWTAYLLCIMVYPNSAKARLTSLGLIAFSSGFGFVYWPKWSDNNNGHFSVDVWQPEAFTFLSIYTTVLFVVATIFILLAFYNLIRGEMTGDYKYAAYAGICGLILGNIHSYDVLHIAAAWAVYLIAISVIQRRFEPTRWIRALIAGLFTLPSTIYQYWVFLHEPVFKARALTQTLAPDLFWYAMGYGLVFFLAAAGLAAIIARRHELIEYFRSQEVIVWIAAWAVAGLSVIYFGTFTLTSHGFVYHPVSFQRKMAMGEHIPLCILAGGTAAYLADFVTPRYRSLLLCLLVVATFPTNALFLLRDLRHVEYDKSEISGAEPFLSQAQVKVLNWLRVNTSPGQAVLAFPAINGQFIPGYADRAVWAGHWSETPDYGGKVSELRQIFDSRTPESIRRAFILSTGTDYLVYPSSTIEDPIATRLGVVYLVDYGSKSPAYLQKVYVALNPPDTQDALTGSYTVFKIVRN